MKMRKGKLIPIQRGLFLALCSWLVIQSVLITEADGVKRLRFRSTTPKTTLAPLTSNSTSSSTSTPLSLSVQETSNENNNKRRTRRRKVRLTSTEVLGKRQGALYSDEDGTNDSEEVDLSREPLYHQRSDLDEQYQPQLPTPIPSHYYSPSTSRRQKKRQRNRQQAFQAQPSYTAPTTDHQDYYSSGPSGPEFNEQQYPQSQPAPKNYAFAYAVRGDDNNAEDFSHKEARDGKLTMGEYRINLPDGRVQVVRYTAGGTSGYKADVTYEGDDPRNKELTKPQFPSQSISPSAGPPYYSPSGPSRSPARKKYSSSSSSSSSNKNPYKEYEGQVFLSRPLKSHRSSLSPFDSYSVPLSATPSPSVYLSSSSGGSSSVGSSSLRSTSPSSSPFYSNYNSNSNSVSLTGRPKSIYDKMTIPPKKQSQKDDYDANLSILHEQSPRAGPTRSSGSSNYNSNSNSNYEYNQQIHEPLPTKKSYFSSTQAPLYNEPGPGTYLYSSAGVAGPTSPSFYNSNSNSNLQGFNYRSPKPLKQQNPTTNYHIEDTPGPSSYTPIKTSKTGGLIPIEHFKAGPSNKKFKKSKSKQREKNFNYSEQDPYQNDNYSYQSNKISRPSYTSPYNSPSSSVAYKEPFHYYNSAHPPYHHGGYTGPQSSPTAPAGISQQTNDPSLSSYSIDFPGGKHSFYIKTGSKKTQSGRRSRKRPNTSGLVYFETPGVGGVSQRPTALGVKDILARIPNMPKTQKAVHPYEIESNIPNPHTTIHPYEIGSKDYGHSVGYKNSQVDHHEDFGSSHNNNSPHSDDYHQYDSHLHSNSFEADHRSDSLGAYRRDYLQENPKGDSIVPEAAEIPSTVDVDESRTDDQGTELEFQFDDVKK